MRQIDLRISRLETWSRKFVVTDGNGAAVDLSAGGATLKLQIKAADADWNPTGGVVLTLTSGSGILGDHTIGEIIPVIEDQTIVAGNYVHELVRVVGGEGKRYWVGRLIVEPGVAAA